MQALTSKFKLKDFFLFLGIIMEKCLTQTHFKKNFAAWLHAVECCG